MSYYLITWIAVSVKEKAVIKLIFSVFVLLSINSTVCCRKPCVLQSYEEKLDVFCAMSNVINYCLILPLRVLMMKMSTSTYHN